MRSGFLTPQEKEYFLEKTVAKQFACEICDSVASDAVEVDCAAGHIFCKECISQFWKHLDQLDGGTHANDTVDAALDGEMQRESKKKATEDPFYSDPFASHKFGASVRIIGDPFAPSQGPAESSPASGRRKTDDCAKTTSTPRSCPVDDEHISGFRDSAFIRRCISNLLVFCPNNARCKDSSAMKRKASVFADSTRNVGSDSLLVSSMLLECEDAFEKSTVDCCEYLSCDWVGTLGALDAHLAAECVERKVQCPFFAFGCPVHFVRFKDLSYHIEEFRAVHNDLVATGGCALPQATHFLAMVFSKTSGSSAANGVLVADSMRATKAVTCEQLKYAKDWNWAVSYAAMCSASNVPRSYLDPFVVAKASPTAASKKRSARHSRAYGSARMQPMAALSEERSTDKVTASKSRGVCGKVLFRVGGCTPLGGGRATVDGMVVDSKEVLELPPMAESRFWSTAQYSTSHSSLIVCGGENARKRQLKSGEILCLNPSAAANSGDPFALSKEVRKVHSHSRRLNASCVSFLDERSKEMRPSAVIEEKGAISWRPIAAMSVARINHSMCLLQHSAVEKVFAIGGSDSKSATHCELYSVDSDTWMTAAKCSEPRENCGVCHWPQRNDSVVVVGGWNSPLSCEVLDPVKNAWSALPELSDDHIHFPKVWIQPPCVHSQSGVICVAGNLQEYGDDLGLLEMYDVRDSARKWMPVGLLKDLLFKAQTIVPQSADDIVVRLI